MLPTSAGQNRLTCSGAANGNRSDGRDKSSRLAPGVEKSPDLLLPRKDLLNGPGNSRRVKYKCELKNQPKCDVWTSRIRVYIK